MASAQVVEMSVGNSSPSQDSSQPDVHFQPMLFDNVIMVNAWLLIFFIHDLVINKINYYL